MIKLNALQLRNSQPTEEELKTLKRQPIYIILDNVLDTYNIGSIFRLADAVAAQKIFICGDALTPPHHRIKKASVNTWEWVEWEYMKTAALAITKMKDEVQNIQIIGVEQNEKSIPFQEAQYSLPVALVVGNESYGVSPEALALCDTIVELPMYGVNTSLNVMVSLGIVLYEVMRKTVIR